MSQAGTSARAVQLLQPPPLPQARRGPPEGAELGQPLSPGAVARVKESWLGHPASYLGEGCLGVAAVPETGFPVAAQGWAQPGRALLPALLPPPLRPPFLLLLLLLLGLLPRFLLALPYLSGTVSDYLLPTVSPRPSLRRPGANSARGQISKRQSSPRGGACAGGAGRLWGAAEGHPGERRGRAGQGVFLTRGSSSSCRAGRRHPTRAPAGIPGRSGGGAASRSPGPAPSPAPLAPRGCSCSRRSQSAQARG